VIELASAGVLMCRLSVELRHGQVFSERAERIASRIGGALLFALADYVPVAAVWHLWKGAAEEFSWPGFIVALIAIPAMRYLAQRKIAIAEKTPVLDLGLLPRHRLAVLYRLALDVLVRSANRGTR
jgi:hypothetical protein